MLQLGQRRFLWCVAKNQRRRSSFERSLRKSAIGTARLGHVLINAQIEQTRERPPDSEPNTGAETRLGLTSCWPTPVPARNDAAQQALSWVVTPKGE
jgi:hypothetical protein